jgi:hypothetical protein
MNGSQLSTNELNNSNQSKSNNIINNIRKIDLKLHKKNHTFVENNKSHNEKNYSMENSLEYILKDHKGKKINNYFLFFYI